MCPVGHGLWKLGLHWGIAIQGNPEEFIRGAPDVYIAGPPDLYDAQAEPSSYSDLSTGNLKPWNVDVTTVEVLSRNDQYTMLRARPAVAAFSLTGQPIAPYVLTFLTHDVSLNSYDLGVTGFSISYSPEIMDKAEFSAGLGGVNETRILLLTCNNESTTWRIETESLRPLPGPELPQEGLQWKTAINKSITITGRVHGGWLYNLHQAAGPLILNLAFAFLGALYGAGLEPKQPQGTPYASKQSKGRSQPQKTGGRSGKRRNGKRRKRR